MDFYLTLTLWPLIWTNIWHGILLAQPTTDHKPHTMSEHAVMKFQLLLIHRISHVSLSAIIMLFVIFWLLPRGLYVAGFFAFSAAVFDIVEVFALNKQTASSVNGMNLHEKTAWLMGMSYLIYAVLISEVAGLSPVYYGTVILICLVMFSQAYKGKTKGFWMMQMLFFTLISFLGFVAHVKLLL